MEHMQESPWYESFFGHDYLEMYEESLTAERTAAEVQGIVNLLGLSPGARLLDLACGHGRHAILLAKLGYEVTGYDLSEIFLRRAQADAEAQGVNVRWVRGDMRRLSFAAEFDAVINVFTAFGYFADPEEDRQVLRGICAALRPGGRFLLETMHRDGLISRFRRQDFEKTANGTFVLHERQWDPARDLLTDQITLIRPDGTRKNYTTAIRLYSLTELIALLKACGMEPESWYGGLNGSPLQLESRRLAIVSRRGD